MNKPLYYWDTLPTKYIVVTTDKFGMQAAHSEYPKWASAANKWVSNGRYDLGLTPAHHEDNPLSLFDFRPGYEKPYWFPQVISPNYDAANAQSAQVNYPVPIKVAAPIVAPVAGPEQGTIAAPRMEAMMAKRNDNTDPTVPIKPAPTLAPGPVTVAPPRVSPLASLDAWEATLRSSIDHIVATLDEMRAAEPNWTKVDHHVNELKKLTE